MLLTRKEKSLSSPSVSPLSLRRVMHLLCMYVRYFPPYFRRQGYSLMADFIKMPANLPGVPVLTTSTFVGALKVDPRCIDFAPSRYPAERKREGKGEREHYRYFRIRKGQYIPLFSVVRFDDASSA